MSDFSKMTYSEFCLLISENDEKVEYVLEYDNFSVVKISEKYYYYDHEEEADSDDFYEVEVVAKLYYSIVNDLKAEGTLDYMFECCVCGEQVLDDKIIYWWFKAIDDK